MLLALVLFGGWAVIPGGTAYYTAADIYTAPNGSYYAIWIKD